MEDSAIGEKVSFSFSGVVLKFVYTGPRGFEQWNDGLRTQRVHAVIDWLIKAKAATRVDDVTCVLMGSEASVEKEIDRFFRVARGKVRKATNEITKVVVWDTDLQNQHLTITLGPNEREIARVAA